MYLILWILYILAFCALSIFLLIRWYSRKRHKLLIDGKNQPKTCVIVTHYGWNEVIEDDFNRVLHEAKKIKAQVIAVTQYINGKPDICYTSLKALEISHSFLKVMISENVCDLGVKRAQKCQNLRLALQSIGVDDCEIIIFIDNDASLPVNGLEVMSKKLMYSNAISATGSRFYVPKKLSIPALIVSAWVNKEHLLQKAANVDLHWGGFCAIKNKFELKDKFFNALENSISDDCALSALVKNSKEGSILVDESVAISSIYDFSWKKLFEFTNRQTILGVRSQVLKIIIPGRLLLAALPLLSLSMIFYSPFSALIMWGMITVIFGIASFSFPGSLRSRVSKLDFLWIFILPFSFILMGYNAFCAIFVPYIQWAGIKYTFSKNGGCQSLEKC